MPLSPTLASAASQYGSLVAAGGAALLGILAAVYPDRPIGEEPRPALKGPIGWPLVGNLPELVKSESEMYDWITMALEEFGITM